MIVSVCCLCVEGVCGLSCESPLDVGIAVVHADATYCGIRRGLKLNHVEATALIATVVMELIREFSHKHYHEC